MNVTSDILVGFILGCVFTVALLGLSFLAEVLVYLQADKAVIEREKKLPRDAAL